MTRELRTIAAMLRLWCREQHGAAAPDGDGLCAPCAELFDYARQRLANCPFGTEKPTCVNCRIHCYGKRQREAVREVMRYAGPRMPLRHPWLSIAHMIDGRRPAPPPPAEQRAAAVLAQRAAAEGLQSTCAGASLAADRLPPN